MTTRYKRELHGKTIENLVHNNPDFTRKFGIENDELESHVVTWSQKPREAKQIRQLLEPQELQEAEGTAKNDKKQ